MQCTINQCRKEAYIHVTEAADGIAVSERHFCEEHAALFLRQYQDQKKLVSASQGIGTVAAVRFEIEIVTTNDNEDCQMLYLREHGKDRRFGLTIGIFEATAILYRLRQIAPPRPMTHDAMVNLVQGLGGQIRDVVVDQFDPTTRFFSAKVRIKHQDQEILVDMRPSDALVLSIICRVPFLITESVLEVSSKDF
jgi:bifunctional DNase/RNase